MKCSEMDCPNEILFRSLLITHHDDPLCVYHHALLHCRILGEKVMVSDGPKIMKLLEKDPETWWTVKELRERLGWGDSATRRSLYRLIEMGKIETKGETPSNMPKLYRLKPI